MVGPWGTWEELVLGGAVLRHGTRNWDLVASELRTRTVYPYYFTPEACKAKYEDLQRCYMGCKSWYEELRKRRVAELKRELEKSEESIGFLVSKLEILKAERAESPSKVKIKTFEKERSKYELELSSGSFTQDIEENPQAKFHIPSQESSQKMELKHEEQESCINKVDEMSNETGLTFRKIRGKRKRKEGSYVESENLGSTGVMRWNETSTSGCDQTVRSSSVDVQDRDSSGGFRSDDLVEIFNSVTENQYALVFRRRLDSQKRARYRNTIKQHMDLDTIRSRIANYSIKSTRELFRDLLLLSNNALVFYSKRTREYKSALHLRGIVTKRYKQLCTDSISISSSISKPLSSILCFSSMSSPPVRPRSIRPRPSCTHSKFVMKLSDGAGGEGPHDPHGYSKSNVDFLKSNADFSDDVSLPSLVMIEKTETVNKKAYVKEKSPESKSKSSARPRRVGSGGRGGRKPPPKNLPVKDPKRAHYS